MEERYKNEIKKHKKKRKIKKKDIVLNIYGKCSNTEKNVSFFQCQLSLT